MLSWIFCSILLFATVEFSCGISFGTLLDDPKPEPLPNFDLNKAFGIWYNKFLYWPPNSVSCQRVKFSYISKTKFAVSMTRVLKSGESKNSSLILKETSPGVYETEYDGKDPVTVTFVDTDYDNYIVTVFTYNGALVTLSVDSRSKRTSLSENTIDKISTKLEAQGVDYSMLKKADPTVEC